MSPLPVVLTVFVLFSFHPLLAGASAARPFQKIEACVWQDNHWNDGDSFHALTGDAGREIVVRLYFVDAPEAETAYRDRLDEQAAYFGIARTQARDLAREAAEFTRKRLEKLLPCGLVGALA